MYIGKPNNIAFICGDALASKPMKSVAISIVPTIGKLNCKLDENIYPKE